MSCSIVLFWNIPGVSTRTPSVGPGVPLVLLFPPSPCSGCGERLGCVLRQAELISVAILLFLLTSRPYSRISTSGNISKSIYSPDVLVWSGRNRPILVCQIHYFSFSLPAFPFSSAGCCYIYQVLVSWVRHRTKHFILSFVLWSECQCHYLQVKKPKLRKVLDPHFLNDGLLNSSKWSPVGACYKCMVSKLGPTHLLPSTHTQNQS